MEKVRKELRDQQITRRQNPKPKKEKAKTTEGVSPGAIVQQSSAARSNATALAIPVTSGGRMQIVKPGTTSRPMYVPNASFHALLSDGFLQEAEDGTIEWLNVPVQTQQQALLNTLPSGMQKTLLAQEFGALGTIVPAEQGLALERKPGVVTSALEVAAASLPQSLRAVLTELVAVSQQMKKFMLGTPSVDIQPLKIKADGLRLCVMLPLLTASLIAWSHTALGSDFVIPQHIQPLTVHLFDCVRKLVMAGIIASARA